MARARLLKPGFFSNEELCELPMEARLAFAGLWTLADREGKLEDRPKRIKAAIFPYDNVDMDPLLEGLAVAGMIARYEVDGSHYIAIVNFEKHQSPHVREPDSVIPNPDGSPPRKRTRIVPAPGSTDADPDEPEAGPAEAEAVAVTGSSSGNRNTDDGHPEAEPEAVAETETEFAQAFGRRLRWFGLQMGNEMVEGAIEESGLECVLHCMDEAERYNGRSWAYVDEIRRRHLSQGCPDPGLLNATERMIGRSRY